MTILVLGAHGPIGLACVRQALSQGMHVIAGVQAPHRMPPALDDLRSEFPARLAGVAWSDGQWPDIGPCERALVAELPIPPAQPEEADEPFADLRVLTADVALSEMRRLVAPTLAAIRFVTHAKPPRALLQASWLGVVDEKIRGGGYALGAAYAAHLMLVRAAALDLQRGGIATVVGNAGRYRLDMAGPAFHADIDEVANGLLLLLDTADANREPQFRDWRGDVRRW